jgi:hypothetical protein
MPNTLKFIAHPDLFSGISLTSPASAWGYGTWTVITQRTNRDIYLTSLQFQVTSIPSNDVTEEVLLEVGLGPQDSEETKIQIPYSFRKDTAVGYYIDTPIYHIPEPVFVSVGTRISIRAADSSTSSRTYEGIKLRFQSTGEIQSNDSVGLFNNFQFPQSKSDGIISITEKMR